MNKIQNYIYKILINDKIFMEILITEYNFFAGFFNHFNNIS